MKKISFAVILTLFVVLASLFASVSADGGDYSAFLRIDNTVKITWRAQNGMRVNIYGMEFPGDTNRVKVAEGLGASTGEYIFDFIAEGTNYSEYYNIEIKNGGETVDSTVVKTEYILPRRSKEITNLQHPYLITTQKDVDNLKTLIETDDFYKKQYNLYKARCDKYAELYTTPESYKARAGRAANEVYELGFVWVLSGDDKYFETGRNAFLGLVDYFFTNTSIANEIKNDYWYIEEAAMGYDLLYNGFNDVERQLIENGVFRKWCNNLMVLGRGRMANQGGVNHVAPTIGLLLKDQELIDIGLKREGYGLFFNMLNAINDDGTMWNQPPMYYNGVWYHFRLAEFFWNANYDFYNYEIKGKRVSEYLDSSCNFREPQYGDIIDVNGMKPFQSYLDYIFYFTYSDGTYPKLGDSRDYGLNYDLYKGILFELGYSRMNDERCAWLLKERFGASRNKSTFSNCYSIFASKPDMGDPEFSIGSNRFGAKGYNKLGSSVFDDFGHVFFRSEGDQNTSTNTTLYWKRYIDNHGHSDMLNMTLYGAGKTILSDHGSYTYGSDVHVNYIQRTISHNTVMIDETEHHPCVGGYLYEKIVNGETTRGMLENVAIGPKSRVVKAWTDRVYSKERNGIDSELQRTVWQIDDYSIDVFKATSDGKTHTFDYPLNVNGELLSSSRKLIAEDENNSLGTKNPGYAYIKYLKKSDVSDGMWHNDYKLGDNGSMFRITMPGGADMQVIAGKTPNESYVYSNDKLVVRQNTDKDAVFVSVLEPVRQGENFRYVKQIPVKIRGNEVTWAKGLKISDNAGTEDTFIYGETYGVKQADNLYSDGESVLLRQVNGEDTILGGMGMKYISGKTISLTFDSQSAAQFTKLNGDCYRLDMGEGTQKATGVTITGLEPGYKVYKLALSDTAQPEEMLTNGLSFTAQSEGIYIIARNNAQINMPAQQKVEYARLPGVNTDSSIDLSNTLTIKGLDKAPEGLIKEAEDILSETGGKIDYTKTGVGDSHTTENEKGYGILRWDNNGHIIKWEVNAPKAGKYKVVFRYATISSGGSDRTFKINDGETFVLHFDITAAWSIREVGMLTKDNGDDILFELKEGTNIIEMQNIGNSLNLDHFTFVPVE